MAIQDELDTPLAHGVRILGGQAATGRELGVDQSTVNYWLKEGLALPAEHVGKFSRATGIPPSKLRPDLAEVFQSPLPPAPASDSRPRAAVEESPAAENSGSAAGDMDLKT